MFIQWCGSSTLETTQAVGGRWYLTSDLQKLNATIYDGVVFESLPAGAAAGAGTHSIVPHSHTLPQPLSLSSLASVLLE
jgi:hypothetical protein